jgi:hypothetical protein
MPNPNVTSFTPKTRLNSGRDGLNSNNSSNSQVDIGGSNLQPGMDVSVTNSGSLTWTGKLAASGGSGYQSTLTCKSGGSSMGDTQDVTVTVSSSNGSGSDTFNVNVGPGSGA